MSQDNTKSFNISPLDSRYKDLLLNISALFSEYSMTRNKVYVEVAYFNFLVHNKVGKLGQLSGLADQISQVYLDFNMTAYESIMKYEEKTKHDIKAVEYYVRDRISVILLKNNADKDLVNYVHYGLTSQDVVSMSNIISLDSYKKKLLDTSIRGLLNTIDSFIENEDFKQPMVARTHGQAAIPTSMSRELQVYKSRIERSFNAANSTVLSAKFGGAIGTMSAHAYGHPEVDWNDLLDRFLRSHNISRSQITTQTDYYDTACDLFDDLRSLANGIIDMSRDMWHYISLNYFAIKIDKANHVGSSTMPQKINPIKFENAEGNAEIARMWFSFFTDKLRISRLQRDLSDSTIVRNFGTAISHLHISIDNLHKGLKSLSIDSNLIKEETELNYQMLAEAIQIKLKVNGYPNAYESVKHKFIGKTFTLTQFIDFIEELQIPKGLKDELKNLTMEGYLNAADINKRRNN